MIAYLVGSPMVDKGFVVIVTNGVGYGVYTTASTWHKCESAEQIALFIYAHIREDSHDLYGFETRQEKDLFLLLLSVSGVGPRTALAILHHHPSEISLAVQEANVGFFTAIPRVGKKLAQKIIIDLMSRLGSLRELELGELPPKKLELKEALLSLGYEEQVIHPLIDEVYDENLSTQNMIKQILSKSH